jgi:hypothetical protein
VSIRAKKVTGIYYGICRAGQARANQVVTNVDEMDVRAELQHDGVANYVLARKCRQPTRRTRSCYTLRGGDETGNTTEFCFRRGHSVDGWSGIKYPRLPSSRNETNATGDEYLTEDRPYAVIADVVCHPHSRRVSLGLDSGVDVCSIDGRSEMGLEELKTVDGDIGQKHSSLDHRSGGIWVGAEAVDAKVRRWCDRAGTDCGVSLVKS